MLNLKFALRTLFKTPFVTVVAIVSLALGIGANAAIFSLFNQLLLRPLPVPQPDRLVNIGSPGPKPGSQSCGNAGGCRHNPDRGGGNQGLATHHFYSLQWIWAFGFNFPIGG